MDSEQKYTKVRETELSGFIYTFESDFVFFSYDVDTNNKGERNDSKLRKNLKKLINSLNFKVPIIILSQVSPGFTRAFSVLKQNIFYQVETLIFGKAIDRA